MTQNKHNKKKIILFVATFIVIIIIGTATTLGVWIYSKYFKVDFIATDFIETNEQLDNPYMGWYKIYGYSLSDTNNYTTNSILQTCRKDPDTRLALLQINLKSYRNSSISDYGLSQLETIFQTFSTTNKSLIVRFVYDWDGKALATEPDNFDTILTHMEQVSGIVNQYAGNIYTMQGLFVGNYGEMNGSNYLSLDNMYTLASKLSSVIDNSIPLAVRTPAQLRALTARDDILSQRLGLYNDGILASESDYGTYGNVSASEASSPVDKLTRADELAFQNDLCNRFPNGGEVINNNYYNDFDNALIDLATMHISYLNKHYDANVLNKWKSSTYTGDDIYNGLSGYDYITTHMGYRYVLSSANVKFDTFKDDCANLYLNIKNVGFASSYHNFNVTVSIKNTDTQTVYELPIDTRTIDWYSNTTTELNIPLDIREYGKGTYSVSFTISDNSSNNLDAKTLIYLANDNLQSDNTYSLGSFTISK